MSKDKLFIGCLTVDIETSLKIAAEVERLKAGHFIDVPIPGGVQGATNGTLSSTVGCASDTQPSRESSRMSASWAIPRASSHCGGQSTGLASKQVNNYLACITMLGACDAINMGLRSGLDPKKLANATSISKTGCYSCHDTNPVQGVSTISSAEMDSEGGFSTEMCKDVLDMALEHKKRFGAKPVLGGAISMFFEAAVEDQRCKGKDYMSIWTMLEDE